MAEKFFPFDSKAGDREYRAADFAAYFGDIIASGVSANGDNLPVTATGGLTVGVDVGKAWIKGHIYENTSTKSLTLANGGSNPRIDRVVARLDVAERKITALLIQGTAAASPTAPALVRTEDYYDIGLAEITVPASAVSITDSNIKDTRTDTDICGVVRCLVEKLDVDAFMKNSQADFEAWLSTLKDMLDDNQAGHLQNEIDAINAALDSGVYSTTAIFNLSTVPGATVEMTLGDITLTAKADDNGAAVLYPAKLGTWALKVTTANATYNESVLVENIGIFSAAVPSFATITPADLDAVGAAGKASVLFKRGDTRTITLTTGESITLRLEDFDHDDLASGGKAPMTLMFEHLMKDTKQMNSSNTNSGGWKNSLMRTSTMATILNTFPAEWRAIIKPVIKKGTAGSQSTSIQTTTDTLWLPSMKEVGLLTTSAGYSGEGDQYPLFTDNASRIKKLSNGSGSAGNWWSRSPYTGNSTGFASVLSDGGVNNSNNASHSYGVCVGLCV